MSASWLHASAVVVGEAGILLLGGSGAGKSTVSRMILDQADAAGRFACLIGDDKVAVTGENGRLLVSGHPAIAGQMEMRGLGIRRVPHEAVAVVRLIIQLDRDVPRLPEPGETREMAGLNIPLLRIRQGDPLAADLVLAALAMRNAAG